jgi:hypothetical protein
MKIPRGKSGQARNTNVESGFEPKILALCLLLLGTDASHLIFNMWN